HGLDTLVEIHVNNIHVLSADNMFRTWEADIRGIIREGKNTIRVLFRSTYPYIKEKGEERWLDLAGVSQFRVDSSNQIRKMQCNYGWDWGPILVTAGIWRTMEIIAWDHARIKGFQIVQEHRNGKVFMQVEAQMDGSPAEGIFLRGRLEFDGQTVCTDETTIIGGKARLEWQVENPRLWWPNGLGEADLHHMTLELVQGKNVMDTMEKDIGLRTMELVQEIDQWGRSFHFRVNGKDFFAKGANWIPGDTFVSRMTPAFYERLIREARDAHMNMLRVWGGGIYEDDVFYELCDRFGICVWQDFMFACSAYPAHDKAFMENVRREALDNIRRIRHHACLALFCGNNEMESIDLCVGDGYGRMTQKEYEDLFDRMLPCLVQEEAPYIPYIPSSPYSPGDRQDYNSPAEGDAHLWDVWHGRKPFEWYRTCNHRFNSEFGFQSFPKPSIVRGYTLPEDRNVSSRIMEYHQRSPIGNDAIMQYMLSWFMMPKDFEMTLYLSQILQALAMKYAVEHWRRSMPRGMGTLYWQHNDCWPGPSWSGLDHRGNQKALHHAAGHFFQPVLLSLHEDKEEKTVHVHLTNDRLESTSGNVEWRILDTDGLCLSEGSFPAAAQPSSTAGIMILPAAFLPDTFLWACYQAEDGTVSENVVFFQRPKHMAIRRPDIQWELDDMEPGVFRLRLRSKVPVFWFWMDVDCGQVRYSDNFFHLVPDREKEVVIHAEGFHLDGLKEALQTYSLHDTWHHPEG
ncbi:MAG: glycoside hydrolase family 2 protein, partial [Clostridia bacterium]